MSILGNIIAALIPPPVTVSGDAADNANRNNDFTGSGLASDRVTFDATKNLDEKFGAGGDRVQDYSKLDGGLGIDTLTIKLTHSQYAALKAELCAKIGAVKAGGLSLDELCSLYKIATGSQFVKFDSIGVELKAWECIKFECVNDAPKAVADSFRVEEDNCLTGSVANDTDFNGDALTYKLVGSLPADLKGFSFNADGSFKLDANHPAYQSLAVGQDKTFVLNYCVSDGKGGSAEATLTIVVCGTNDAPVAVADKFHTTEDAAIVKGSVTASDVDLGDTLKFSVDPLTKPAGLTFNDDGSYEFDPSNIAYQSLPEGEVKNIVVEYTVSDGNGGTTTSTLTICITGTHDCPIGNILKVGVFDASDIAHDIDFGAHASEGWNTLKVDGWDNLGDVANNAIEVWDQDGVSQRVNGNPDIDGLYAIETDGYGDGHLSPTGVAVEDHFKAIVDAELGKTYTITFNFASRTDLGGRASDTDSFKVLWNGVAVGGTFDPDPANPGWNFASIRVTGISGNDILEIVELGANDSYGAIIDKVRVTGEMCGDPVVTPTCHPELLQNWDFEKDIVGPNGFSEEVSNRPVGWENFGDNSNAINVHTASFAPFYGYGDGEKQWFDTAKSPGNAHIGQFVNLEEGHTAILSISAAKMAGLYQGTPYATDLNAKVEFVFNGVVVKTISVADFATANEFKTFDIEVTGAAGPDKFEIRSTGQEASYGGFAVDHVSLKGTGTLFAENFDGYATPGNTVNGGPTWVYSNADVTTGGWESTSAGANEVAIDGYAGVMGSTSGSHWFDTQGTTGPVNISHNFIDNTAAIAGATAVLSFDIAKQDFGVGKLTDPNASFEVRIDGNVVAQIDAADLANFNQMKHFEVVIDASKYTGLDSTHTVELVDTSEVASNYGFSIDSVQIRDVTICEPAPTATPHLGGNLFTENFDETPLTVYGAPSGPVASGTIDLVKEGWTGTGHNDDFGSTTVSEVAFSGMFGPTKATTGNAFLDTQNTPGQINISHAFTDNTAAINGKTAVLSFDIGKMNIDWGGGFQTNANETFEFRIDDQKVAEFTASQFNDALLHHFDIDISDYADNADSIHTLSLVNTSAASSTIGFAVDSIQINDWVI